MMAVGKPAAERALGVQDGCACAGNQSWFLLGTPSRAMVATNAGTFYGGVGGASGTGGGAAKVSGCANVRDAPGLSSHVVACLPNGTVVDVDSAPVYLD